MKIRYLGHSCFLLTGASGATVVTDPYGDIGYSLPRGLKADVVTVSHDHFDHNNVKGIDGEPEIVCGEGNYRFSDVSITGIGSFHDDARGRKRGGNIVYKFVADGLTVCHLGDLGEECSEALLKKIGGADILLIPVGGIYTIDGRQAKEYADKIRPAIVIPMHYKTPDLSIELNGIGEFLGLFARDRVETLGKDEAEFTRDDLTGKSTKIIVMEKKL